MRVRDTWLLDGHYFDEPSDSAISPELQRSVRDQPEEDSRLPFPSRRSRGLLALVRAMRPAISSATLAALAFALASTPCRQEAPAQSPPKKPERAMSCPRRRGCERFEEEPRELMNEWPQTLVAIATGAHAAAIIRR